eukprot:scaffold212741_cov48-Attheya_sp.AAC.2
MAMSARNPPLRHDSSHLRRPRSKQKKDGDSSSMVRFLLLVACLWPVVVYLWLSSASSVSVSSSGEGSSPHHVALPGAALRKQMTAVLRRVDIFGYGPSHPRVAVVIVGSPESTNHILSAVDSVFRNTDRNRLLVVCVVMDGMEEDAELVGKFDQIDSGSVPHWHGLKRHAAHSGGNGQEDEHGQKMHVIFNAKSQGVAASRSEATEFIHILAKKHEEAGLKSADEDLLLLLLREDAQLVSPDWLGPVTSALIIPPTGEEEEIAPQGQLAPAKKLANAISFAVSGGNHPQTTAFGLNFNRKLVSTSGQKSYVTPALDGAAT